MIKALEISEGIKEIARKMVENPNDWRQGDFEFFSLSNPDIRIWTANGHFALHLQGNSSLTWAEKHYLIKAIKKSIGKRLPDAHQEKS